MMKDGIKKMNIRQHLIDRGIDFSKIKPFLSEHLATFLLWNLSGQIIGYQCYNPLGTKAFNQKKADRDVMRYFTYVSGSQKTFNKQIAIWGLESFCLSKKRIFITEGLFDAAPFHHFDECALAVLSNDPCKSVIEWLKVLPQEKIVIRDNDKAGIKLQKVGDRVVKISSSFKDCGEAWEEGGFTDWFNDNFR